WRYGGRNQRGRRPPLAELKTRPRCSVVSNACRITAEVAMRDLLHCAPTETPCPITSHNQVWAKSVKSRVVSTPLKAGHCELVVAHPKQGASKVECLTDLYNPV